MVEYVDNNCIFFIIVDRSVELNKIVILPFWIQKVSYSDSEKYDDAL